MILLQLIFLNQILLNKFWYNFDTVLYQFLEIGTSEWTLIGLDQLQKFLGFSLHPAFYFPLLPL